MTKFKWALVALAFIVISCNKDVENINTESNQETPEIGNKIIIGEQLENPYSVDNMRLALDALKSSKKYASKTFKSDFDIQTTDYYVKFWTENNEQKNLLLADSLNLSVIPLDVEIEQEGDYMVDENTELEQSQWLYTSVEKDYQFHQDIKYEILENLFLIEPSEAEEIEGDEPEDENTTTTIAGKSGISKDFLYDLEDQALKLTGNYTPPDSNELTARRSKRKPKGYIKVLNTVTRRLDPVVGVKIKTRRWFKWAKGWTNSRGYYQVNRGYRRNVHYTVVFKNTRGFKIWPYLLSLSSARYRAGSHSKFGHSITFYTNSGAWSWATVNNATVKYLDYCRLYGIGKPHSNLRILASRKDGASSAPMLSRTWGIAGFTTNSKAVTFLSKANNITLGANALWIILKVALPDLIIKAHKDNGTDGVFSTTFHELGHASHFKKVGSRYWIKYINYIITYGIFNDSPYGDGHGKNAQYCGIGEMWGNYISSVFMNEEFGFSRFTRGEDWYNPGFLEDVDNISDVTTAEIYSSLTSSTTTFEKLIIQLKNKTTQDEKVDKAFENYSDWP